MKPGVNVSESERVGSFFGGLALLIAGLMRGRFLGRVLAVLGGYLAYRGMTGRCALYRYLEINHAAERPGVPDNVGINVEKTIRVERPAPELFAFWRKLENLPRIMPHIESVQETGINRSHWVVRGPAGSHLEWDAEIITEHPGEMIAWQSLPGAEVQNAGSVWFKPVNGATEVKVALQYNPPAGSLGAAVASLLGESPEQQLEQDLGRFKQLSEHLS